MKNSCIVWKTRKELNKIRCVSDSELESISAYEYVITCVTQVIKNGITCMASLYPSLEMKSVSLYIELLKKGVEWICWNVLTTKKWFGLVLFYGISTLVAYLMPNPVYITTFCLIVE